MKFIDENDAKEQELVPLTIWLFDNEDNRQMLQMWHKQVMSSVLHQRRAAYVKCCVGSRIALFVNDVTSKEDFKKGAI